MHRLHIHMQTHLKQFLTNILLDFDVRGQHVMDLFTGRVLLWIVIIVLLQTDILTIKRWSKVENTLIPDLFLTKTQLFT